MEVLPLFEKTEAILSGHFLLSSGLHSERYMQCARLLAHPVHAEALGRALAAKSPKPDLVVSPAMGGLIIGQEVARALGVRHYFTERENGVMTMRRGFSLDWGETVALVEDVVTTGKSSREVADLLASKGAKIVSWLSIVNRSPETEPALSPSIPGVTLKSLAAVSIPSHKPEACPLCKQGLPVIKPGSRTQPK
jgi:orotate phosphoribosyltransferase